ncbi:histamine H2 receptor-like [Stylophora pistillata]|uniref:histamine H2 receptor-like n=1 Tax=Stylophora pistillata TaxID=50429 RepID=UPI000C0479D9|nr:histamine H2 receptor-like [Stylophora pistillata]
MDQDNDINASNSSYGQNAKLTLDVASDCIPWLVVSITECLAIFICNLITVIVFVKQRQLQRRSTYLIILLSIVDLLFGAVSGPVIICDLLGFYCDFWKYNTEIFPLANLFPVTSIVNLAVISLERLHATFSPFNHRFIKKWVYGVVIGAVWLITSTRETIQVLLYKEERIISPVAIAFSPYTYWSVSLLVICICYISIFIKVRYSSNPQRHGAINRERKLTATLLWITLASLLTWLPYIVFSLNTTTLNLRSVFHISMTLAALVGANSLLNPIVYALRMPDFREGIRRIFRRTQRRIAPVSLPRQNFLQASRLY